MTEIFNTESHGKKGHIGVRPILSNLTRPYSVEKSPYNAPLLFKEALRVKSAKKKGDTLPLASESKDHDLLGSV